MSDIGSIDDLLASQGTEPKFSNQPEISNEPEASESHEEAADLNTSSEYDESESHENKQEDTHAAADAADSAEEGTQNDNVDEYGNEKPKPRTYTEEEHKEILNKVVRERLSRGNHTNQAAQAEVAQQVENFQPSDDSNESWEAQLEQMIERTLQKVSTKATRQQQQQAEQQAHADLQYKIQEGLNRFDDFAGVVGSQPITDTMTQALRGMNDPAAFIYAAAKRAPKDLERISRLDPYAQIREIGKLEDKMKQSRSTTKAPRPLSHTSSDGIIPRPKDKKEPTIEDLIAASDAKRRAQLRDRRR